MGPRSHLPERFRTRNGGYAGYVKHFTLISARKFRKIAHMRNFLKWLRTWFIPQVPPATVYNLRDFARNSARERRAKSL
jgi:hypothetical protein